SPLTFRLIPLWYRAQMHAGRMSDRNGDPKAPDGGADDEGAPLSLLRPFERSAFMAMDWLHRRARPLTELWLRDVTARWMAIGSRNMMRAVGLERLHGLGYDDGILLVANPRIFFVLYMLMLLLHRYTPLRQPVLCPVRADFFYQRAAGVAVNLFMAGGRM